MAFEFKLPDIGEGVAEGEIVKWLVKAGDAVREDQPLVEVMTDKATVEIPSPRAGTVAALACRRASGPGRQRDRRDRGRRRREAGRHRRCGAPRHTLRPRQRPRPLRRPAAVPPTALDGAGRARRAPLRRCARSPASWASRSSRCRQRPERTDHARRREARRRIAAGAAAGCGSPPATGGFRRRCR